MPVVMVGMFIVAVWGLVLILTDAAYETRDPLTELDALPPLTAPARDDSA